MRALQPGQFAWALVALIPIILYLVRRRPRRVPVSSLLFFKALSREHRESAWLRWLKRLLSLLLTLMVIGGAVGALARLVSAPAAGDARTLVIVLDRSASMAARDERGATRLQAGVERVRERLAGVSGATAVMLISFARQAEIVVPRSFDRRVLERALAAVTTLPVEGEAEPALRLAAEVAALEKPSAIWFVSDAAAPTGAGVAREEILVPLGAARNAGITAFDLRRVPLEGAQQEAFVRLQGSAPGPLDVKLEVRIDGTLTAVREVSLRPGEGENLLLPVGANAGRILTLRAVVPGDQLPADDEVQVRLPEARPWRVIWISEEPDPFTQIALTALSRDGELNVFSGKPSAWPPAEAVDVAIFQKWLPEQWPENVPVIVIDPPGARGPVQVARLAEGGLPVEHLRATRERHPLLYGVATARLAVTQSSVLEANGPLDPLWSGPAGTLLAAGEYRGQRVAVFAFAPERSENLPLSASYPLLLGNALQWAAQPKSESADARPRRTGEPAAVRGKALRWLNTSGSSGGMAPVQSGWAMLDRVGLWETDAGDRGSTALLSARETVLPAQPAATRASERGSRWWRGDLMAPLLWIVFGVLLVESWLFHRYAVH